jgi:hypothetical protein
MAKMIKKAQSGVESAMEAATAKRNTKGPEFRPGQVKRMTRVFEANPERGVKVAKRMLKRANAKAEKGGEFGMLSVKAGIDKNPNPTQADRIAGAKKKAMSGMEIMKKGGKAAKQAAIAIAMKKDGKAPKKKMKSGGTVSMQLGSYDRQIGKNYTGKNVVNKGAKAKMGKSIMKMGGKCKNGC